MTVWLNPSLFKTHPGWWPRVDPTLQVFILDCPGRKLFIRPQISGKPGVLQILISNTAIQSNTRGALDSVVQWKFYEPNRTVPTVNKMGCKTHLKYFLVFDNLTWVFWSFVVAPLTQAIILAVFHRACHIRTSVWLSSLLPDTLAHTRSDMGSTCRVMLHHISHASSFLFKLSENILGRGSSSLAHSHRQHFKKDLATISLIWKFVNSVQVLPL